MQQILGTAGCNLHLHNKSVTKPPYSADADPQDTVWNHTFEEKIKSPDVTTGSLHEHANEQTAGKLVGHKKMMTPSLPDVAEMV